MMTAASATAAAKSSGHPNVAAMTGRHVEGDRASARVIGVSKRLASGGPRSVRTQLRSSHLSRKRHEDGGDFTRRRIREHRD